LFFGNCAIKTIPIFVKSDDLDKKHKKVLKKQREGCILRTWNSSTSKELENKILEQFHLKRREKKLRPLFFLPKDGTVPQIRRKIMKAKKVVTVGLAAALAASVIAGCGSSGGDGTGSSGKTEITIYQSKIEANEGYKKAIEAYEATHPDVTINLEAVTGNDFSASLKAKMQSDPPTIFSVGGFQDLKDYGDILEDVSDMEVLDYALDGTTDMFTQDGKVLAVPLYMEGYGFVVNRQIFEDAGVDFDSMMTFEGMKEGFDTLKEKIDSGEMKEKYPNLEAVMEYPTKELWIAGDHDANVALTHEFASAKDAYAADTMEGTGFADYKTMVDFQAGYTTNADNTANLNSVDYTTSLEGGLAIERVAAIKQGNWVAPAVETTDPEVLEKLDMLPYSVPGYSDGKYFVGVSGYWAINSTVSDEKKEAAKDFINWLYTSEEGQKIVVEDCKFVPPYNNFGELKASDPLSQRIMDANEAGDTMDGWVYSGAPNTWGQQAAGVEVQKYLAGQATWDEVTQSCIDQWATMREAQK
jgi:raffinose/stachyose/melibiose transport system substrate-binding protein